ncbi:MAG: AMP-binding protein, partial [Candidatus Eremiobacteraeota bacterium]|nr:AMP-binding protein [Candidatus Eremiobacteraeota bacterium]
MNDDLFGWITGAPATDRGIRVASATWSWERRSHAELAALSARTAHGLLRAGLQRNDPVAIVCPPGAHFVAALYGT